MSDVVSPLVPQEAPALLPLVESHDADQLELELKGLFIKLFDQFIRPGEREINTVGTPHLGPFEQVERAVKTDGLALLRRGDEATMRYIFKAWRARNPKRGLHMLHLYLRMLWPNGYEANQMWCPVGGSYPADCVKEDGGNHFLTSRVQVKVSGAITDGQDVATVAPALRSVIPARLLLNVAIEQNVELGMALACAGYQGCVIQSFEANFV